MLIHHILGTDTGIGKTYTTCQIMKYLQDQNKIVAAMKPIASGTVNHDQNHNTQKKTSCSTALNEDVIALLQHANYRLEIEQINPFHFKYAIAPHIAAYLERKVLSLIEIYHKVEQIINSIKATKAPLGVKNINHLLIEGVGGVLVPLNNQELYLDLVAKTKYPIILVVGMRLGALNHTLLTAEAILKRGLKLVGWIANQIDPQMPCQEENIEFLKQYLSAPLIANIPYQSPLIPTPNFSAVFK